LKKNVVTAHSGKPEGRTYEADALFLNAQTASNNSATQLFGAGHAQQLLFILCNNLGMAVPSQQ
jgi:hypothetical protein